LNFVEISDNSKINALGGNNISLDHGYFFINPALIKERSISINYLNYILDINSSSILFSDSSNFLGNYGIGIKYFSHGKFDGYDNFGNYNGDFYPKEYLLTFSKSYKISKFSIGSNLKYFYSKLYNTSNSGLIIDVGANFTPYVNKEFNIAIVFSNIGFLLGENQLLIPSNIKIGTSFKPEYMPLRFSLTYMNSQKSYEKENFSLGIEVLLSKYFNIMLGYNLKNDTGFKLNNPDKLRGISYGLELVLKRFKLNYSRLILNSISSSNNISINYELKRK
tara:strand:- start:379 stop:1212 length:834 start_codon:yes stop_codon:yes gene_type:complete